MPDALSKDRLLDLYRIAIDEYRFQVKLNWDRSMYYVVFNTALLSVATGLLKNENHRVVIVFIALLFLVGATSSIFGVLAVRKAHEYYQRTIFKKTLLEDVLGLAQHLQDYPSIEANLALGTTKGQAERTKILYHTDEWVTAQLLRRGSVVFYIACVLTLLAVAHIAGVITSMTIACTKPMTPYIPWP